jgi:hypothetical protein
MSGETSARLALPLLVPGQAQKEMTHNEALATLDLLVQASVTSVGLATPPSAPVAGQCWIVGEDATGAWADRDGAIAGWTAGGWRFATPGEGMVAWDADSRSFARYADGNWMVGALLGNPLASIILSTGGPTADFEARAAISSVIMVLRNFGLIAQPENL